MKKRVIWLSAVLASAAALVFAADIDGKWTAETQGRNGTVTQTLELKSSGMNLTGTLDNGRGGMPLEIKEGMIHESDVTFKVTQMGRNGEVTVTYSGKLDGDTLKLTPMREGGGGGGGGRGPQELTFKRAQ
jgi:hypothetical protein